MFDVAYVEGVNGCVQALSSVQSDGVLVPRAHHTQSTMRVLQCTH